MPTQQKSHTSSTSSDYDSQNRPSQIGAAVNLRKLTAANSTENLSETKGYHRIEFSGIGTPTEMFRG